MLLDPSLVARVYERAVKTPSGCRLWLGAKTADGYGVIRTGSRQDASRRVVRVHRLIYELHHGPITAGLEVSHTCNTRHCVEPSHLIALDHAEVIARGETGVPQKSRTHCPAGHAYDLKNTRLTPGGRRVCRACDRMRKQRRRDGPMKQVA